MKRILTIQDISCVGTCSLTVALPILSVMGLEACPLPTAVLSSHTLFENVTCHDLTDDLLNILTCWEKEGVSFDGIYTGYLSSKRQVQIVQTIIKRLRGPGCPVIVDPAMADHGKLYRGFDEDFVSEMKLLCDCADVIVPNLTEAAFLTGEGYKDQISEADIRQYLRNLTSHGAKAAVLTGVSLSCDRIGCMGYEAKKEKMFYYANEKLEKSSHGTGDVFASVMSGALVLKKSLYDSAKMAVDFTLESMKQSRVDPKPEKYGVSFEKALPYLYKLVGDES